jgi:hypothetical protein
MYKKFCSAIQTLFLLSFLLSIVSCQSEDIRLNENAEVFSSFPKESEASFTKLFDFNKGSAYNMHVVDSTLIIFNEQGQQDYFFYNYSLAKNTLSKGYLRGGRGPSEGIGIASSGVIDNTFWAYDITLRKGLSVPIDVVLAHDQDSIVSFQEHSIPPSYYITAYMDAQHYLGVGSFDSQFKVQEVELASKKQIAEFGTFKNVPTNMDFNAYKSAHQSFIFVKPDGSKAVLMYRFTDAIEIFDLNTKEGKSIHGPYGYAVEFKPMNTGDFFVMQRIPKTRFAFTMGAVTNKYIYAIYSGKLEEDLNPHFGNTLFVYDWDGNPVKKINLDRVIQAPAVTEDDSTLYAYDPNTGFILKTNLN